MTAPTTTATPSGEVTNIDAHRSFLAQVGSHLAEVVSSIEQAQAHADAQQVPQAVLDAGAQVQEAVQAAAAQAYAAVATLNEELAAAEQAMKALDRATSSEYLRGE